MPQIKDMKGQRFGRLVVIEFAYMRYGRAFWKCKCDCGNEMITDGNRLRMKVTKSCGCYQAETRIKTHSIHGMSKTRLNRIWSLMKDRCCNSKSHAFENYGGRGIDICEEWKNSFSAFAEWAFSNGYSDNLTIDRIDNNKGYYPDNCRWANEVEQSQNRRSNYLITYKGETKCIKAWTDELGLPYNKIRRRICRDHWDIERAFTTP